MLAKRTMNQLTTTDKVSSKQLAVCGKLQLPAEQMVRNKHVTHGDFHIVSKTLPPFRQFPVYREVKRKLGQYSVHNKTTAKAETVANVTSKHAHKQHIKHTQAREIHAQTKEEKHQY